MKQIFTFLLFSFALINSYATTPTNPSTNLTSGTIEGNSITFAWTRGNGANRLIIARKDNPVTALPVNGTDHIANNSFGLGNEISTGQFVVYKGSGNGFNLIGLLPNSTYHIALFEFNGSGFTTEYLTAAFLSGKLMNQQTMKNQTIVTVDISNLNAGIYMVQLVADNNISRMKFMKTN
jgi:hypothetical protein